MKMKNTHINILLVDDNTKFLASAAERAKLKGFTVFTAENGASALEIAKDKTIHVAVVDHQMPDMNGLVVITKLKEMMPDIRTILLTGHGDDKLKEATQALNTTYFDKQEMGRFWEFLTSLPLGSLNILRQKQQDSTGRGGPSNARHGRFGGHHQTKGDRSGHRHPAANGARQRKAERGDPGDQLPLFRKRGDEQILGVYPEKPSAPGNPPGRGGDGQRWRYRRRPGHRIASQKKEIDNPRVDDRRFMEVGYRARFGVRSALCSTTSGKSGEMLWWRSAGIFESRYFDRIAGH
jgi:CheY-like chemotaxis protein